MPTTRSKRIPSYRLHRPTGLAVVRLNGKDFYLGKHGTSKSRMEYERLIAEWLSNHRQLSSGPGKWASVMDSTFDEVLLAYWSHAKNYYVKRGEPTSTLYSIKAAFRPLHELYGQTVVSEFGPLALKTVQSKMIALGWSRSTINKYVGVIKRVVKWAAANELAPSAVSHSLQAVSGLGRGRSVARETDPVGPVPEEHVDAILPFLTRQLQSMIELQELTGMRPGEATGMRGCNLDVTGSVWTYKPGSHKTEHHDRQRIIYIGPRAQAVIRPFLKEDLSAYLFSPADAEAERNVQRRGDRKSPTTPKTTPRERYDKDSYRRAIQRACDKAGVPRWCPNQLRHNAATFLRKDFGIEAARVILGHSSAATTEIYAELDRAKAIEIMGKVG